MARVRIIRSTGLKVVMAVEDVGLLLILAATLFAAGQEIAGMIAHRRVTVSDLLMLFIFMEVISMVSTYWRLDKLPVRMPLYIAMVSLARFLILDTTNMHELAATRDVYVSLAIFILALTVVIVRYGHLKLPYPASEEPPHE